MQLHIKFMHYTNSSYVAIIYNSYIASCYVHGYMHAAIAIEDHIPTIITSSMIYNWIFITNYSYKLHDNILQIQKIILIVFRFYDSLAMDKRCENSTKVLCKSFLTSIELHVMHSISGRYSSTMFCHTF